MAGSPAFKVHNPQGTYIAACKHVEDAAAIVALYGNGAKIKHSGRIVWKEGDESFAAGESFDRVVIVVAERIAARAGRSI